MKTLNFGRGLLLIVLIFPSVGEGADLSRSSVKQLASHRFQNFDGTFEVTTRENTSNLGLPYTIEIQAKCSDSRFLTRSFPVCDVKPKSIRLSSDGNSIFAKVRETDSESFNLKTQSMSAEELKTAEPECKSEAKELEISLVEFCKLPNPK